MYQNTSHELLRRGLAASDIPVRSISVLGGDPKRGETEFGIAIHSIGLIELMDRFDNFAVNMRKINRVMVPRLFAFYSQDRQAWIVRVTLHLMTAFEV